MKARSRPQVAGSDAMLGTTGEAVGTFDKTGWVRLDGEIWQCQTKDPIKNGQKVQVEKVDNLTLHVKPVDDKKN